MSIQEIQHEMIQIKVVLSALQLAIEKLSSRLDIANGIDPMPPIAKRDSVNWMALEGVGADLWRTINVDAYLDEERNGWN